MLFPEYTGVRHRLIPAAAALNKQKTGFCVAPPSFDI